MTDSLTVSLDLSYGCTMTSDTNYPELGQPHRLRAQSSIRLHSLQIPAISLGISRSSSFPTSWLQIQGFPLPLQDGYLTSMTHRTQESATLMIQLKDTNQNQPKGETLKVRFRRVPNVKLSLSSPHRVRTCHSPSTSMCEDMQSIANCRSSLKLQGPEFLLGFNYISMIN